MGVDESPRPAPLSASATPRRPDPPLGAADHELADHELYEQAMPGSQSAPEDSKISVVVVATERLFRLGLAGLLSEEDRLDVIGVSSGEPDLVGACKVASVDVVLVDIQLAETDGLGLVRRLAAECPDSKTLVLMSTADWRVRPALLAGAAGILLKDTSPEAIRAAVISVHLGDQVLCSEAARWVLGEERPTHLTQRESQVLHMVAQGANNGEIATQLQLSQKTVRNYVSRLYRKLALTTRGEITKYMVSTDIEHNAAGPADGGMVRNEPLAENQ